jgi:hypothetical protein
MRVLTFASCAALVAFALVSCSAKSNPPSSPGFDVYVPMPEDGGDATMPSDASEEAEGGFGLGQIDRAGRPLVTTLLVATDVQDEYNSTSTFAADVPRVLQDSIASRIAQWDTLVLADGGAADPVDWPEGGALLPMLLGDTLLVDTALPCVGPDGGFVASYLDLEREAFLDAPSYAHTTCGGRTPNEPVVDETLTLLVTADRPGGPEVTQGIAGPTRPATTTFPYLSAPN